MGTYAGSEYVFLEFGHQGAELLSTKGGKMGVLAVFRDFKAVRTPNRC